jgi:O-antigen ligase
VNRGPGPALLHVLLVLVLLDTLVLGLLGLTPATYLDFDTPKQIVLGLGAATLLVVRVAGWPRRRRQAEPVPVDGATIALIALAFLALLGAVRAHDAMLAARRLAVIAAAAILFLEARWRIRDPARLLAVLAAIGAVVAAYGLLQAAGFELLDPRGNRGYGTDGRPVSTLGNPNFAASLLALLVPCAAATAILGRGKVRALALLSGALMIAHLVVARSRAGWLGVIVVAAVAAAAFLTRRAGSRARAVAVATAVLVPALLATVFTALVGADTGALPIAGRLDTVRVRGLVWSGTTELIGERPLLGQGLSDFTAEYERVRPEEEYRLSLHRVVGTPHNVVLHVAAEMGLPAALLLLAFVTLTARGVLRGGGDRPPGVAAVAGLAGALGMLAAGLFASPLSHPGHVAALFVVLGAVAGPPDTGRREAHPMGRPVATLAALGLLVAAAGGVLAWLELRCEREVLRSAPTRESGGRTDAAALRRAVRWSPANVVARTRLGLAEKSKAAGADEKDEHLEAARESYRWVLRVRPHDTDTRVHLALVEEDAGRTDRMEACLRDALRIRPFHPIARFNLAGLRDNRDERDEAITEYFRLLETLGIRGPEAPGETDLRRLRALETKCLDVATSALSRLQVLLLRTGRADEMIPALECAESWYPHPDRPDPAASRMRVAVVLAGGGTVDRAIEILLEVVRELRAAGREPDARRGISYAVKAADRLVAPLIRAAERRAEAGAFDVAETLLAGVVRADAASGDAWTALERIARRRNEVVRARSYLVRARLAYAREAALEGDLEQAARQLKVAESRGAAESAVRYLQAILCVSAGRERYGEGLRYLEAAAEAGFADLDRLEADAQGVLAPLAHPESPNWQRVLLTVRENARR